jgi:Flp pilus assembly protein TadG
MKRTSDPRKSDLDPAPSLSLPREPGTAGWGRRLWHDRQGATAVLIAIGLPVLLAITGLGVDAGWWYMIHRQNQSAADAAAISAAYQVANALSNGATPSVTNNLVPAATQAAHNNGYGTSYGGAALSGVSATPPTSCTDPGGSWVCYQYAVTFNGATATGVEVVLRAPQTGLFSNFASLAGVTIANRAIAIVNQLPPGCLLALNPTAPDTINLAGNPTLNAPDCTVVSDSDASSAIHLQGNATLNAATIVTPGEWSHTGAAFSLTTTYPPQIGANYVPDPYASTLTHSNFVTDGLSSTTAACTSSSGGKNLTNYANPGGTEPGCIIAGGLDIKNSTVNLAPGTYWLTGNLTLESGNGATLECTACSNGGAGVTIILTAPLTGGTVGTVTLDSNADLDLNAPSSGPFAGMVLIQDSNGLPGGIALPNPDDFNAQANATETLSGLVYFPDAAVTFQGTPVASGPQCLLLVANTVALQGTPGFNTTGCSSLGLNKLPIVYTVALVG